jgi:hypothetical protein
MGVEPEGLSFSSIFGSMAISVVVVVVLVVIGATYAGYRFQNVKLEVTQTTGYPLLHETQMMGATKLEGFGKAEDGQYTIPIERAMELEVQDAAK